MITAPTSIPAAELERLLALINGGRAAEALPELDRLLTVQPEHPGVLALRAEALRLSGQHAEALDAYRKAGEKGAGARNWLVAGTLLAAERRTDEAVSCLQRAIAESPNDGHALDTLVTTLFNANRYRDALGYARQQLATGSDPQFLSNAALVLQMNDCYDESSEAFKKILKIAPDDPAVIGAALAAARFTCEWDWIESLQRRINTWYDAGDFGAPREFPLTHLGWCADEARNLGVTRAYAERTAPQVAPCGAREPRAPDGRIRVGYVSCDFRNHATMHLMAGVFECHDRERFEVFAYDYSSHDISEYRQRFVDAVEHRIDIDALSDRQAALRIAQDRLDILFDLKVYTGGGRAGIFAYRPAPLQVSYLGYPGPCGSAHLDYIVSDRFVTPDGSASFYTEKFCRLPHSYQCNDRKRASAPQLGTRAMHGLPEDAIAFGAFNQSHKMDRASIGVWLRVLKEVPKSVLWILGQTQTSVANVARQAELAGIAPARLIFAPFADPREHLARLRLADAVLDALVYNGHTTTSDALWAGVPVITARGKHFPSRVSESLLNAMGLTELVGADHDDMVRIAKRIGSDSQYRTELRTRIAANRLSSPLFDTARFTRDLETAIETMVARHRSGAEPALIDVPDGGPVTAKETAATARTRQSFAETLIGLPGGKQRKFYLRPDSVGDNGVFKQVFRDFDYDLAAFARTPALRANAQQRFRTGLRPLIIDAGANIGASAVFFAVTNPESRVIAIEPEERNMELLRLNSAGLDVVLQKAALGCERGTAFLSDPGQGDWGFRVGPQGSIPVPVISVRDVLASAEAAGCFPMMCKINIEGGEAPLFEKNTEWLELFPLVIIKLHDWLLPGEANSRNFLRAIAARNFDFLYRGENTFCFNNAILGPRRA